MKNNFWAILSAFLFLLLIVSIFTKGFGLQDLVFSTSKQKIGENAVEYINKNLLAPGMKASLIETAKEPNGLYKINLKIENTNQPEQSQEFTVYVSSDGKMLFPQGIAMKDSSLKEGKSQSDQDIPKREKPDVKLFVMSYCPYGLQAEKMYLPVYNLLKDKAEMGIYFVSYVMHGKKELDENLRQYCIKLEQEDKFYDYVNCFVRSEKMKECYLKITPKENGGTAEILDACKNDEKCIEEKFGECIKPIIDKCLNEAKIDKTRLNSCMVETDRKYNITSQYEDKSTWINGKYPKFEVEEDLNKRYKVEGSPTIVINDKMVEINPRTPENFKEMICRAFISKPKECSQSLSDKVPSPGFGGNQVQ